MWHGSPRTVPGHFLRWPVRTSSSSTRFCAFAAASADGTPLRKSTASAAFRASLKTIHGSQSNCATAVFPDGPTTLSATAK